MISLIVLVIFVVHAPHVVSATDCPDAGVVVVASVFATLAVVFVVLGILGLLIWKRRRDISRPEKFKSDVPDDANTSGGKFGYSNPAFDKDPEAGDGVAAYVTCRDNVPDTTVEDDCGGADGTDMEEMTNYGADRDLAKKTWSSLPPSDLPYVRQRKSSLGSLDRNKLHATSEPCLEINYILEPEDSTVEVWLTSQDFIGLGFNIAGSMRDGIFVSQVHNRGPANESGKFKVGDRIMSVGISFENMVYEDALTILSYASPYPVQVKLQKQQMIPKNRKLSDIRTNLNHPLYRSHSVDALSVQSKEHVFHPKRAASEMRHDKNDSPKVQRLSMNGFEGKIAEEAGIGPPYNDVFETETPVPKINALVHRVDSDTKDKFALDREVSIAIVSDIPNATIDLNTASVKGKTNESESGTDSQYLQENNNFADPFENLTEQDKLDMLRLSYADPDAVPNTSFDTPEKSIEINITPIATNGDLKSIPVKPERKKKRSSTNSITSQSDGEFAGSGPSMPKSATPHEAEICSSELAAPTEAPPPVPDEDEQAEEEDILPEVKIRNITVNSCNIILEPVSPALDSSAISADKTFVGDYSLMDMSLSENDATLVASTPKSLRSDSLTGDPIVEDDIAATQIEKDRSVHVNSRIFLQNENADTETGTQMKKSGSSSSDEKFSLNNESVSRLPSSVPMSEDVFDKDLPELDMNLDFDTATVLFKDSYPSRNTKEYENGVAYDISVTELDAMEQEVRDEECKKRENQNSKGGIAFQVIDDFTTGKLRTVNTYAVHRTASYDNRLASDRFKDNDMSSQRPTSFKGEIKTRNEAETGVLDWSGKRLVRSGSFSEIPQDDSIKDWTDDQCLEEDDALIEKHIEEDSKSTVLTTLTRATLVSSNYISNQDKDDLSDADSRCRSLSSSISSVESSPPRTGYFEETNGNDDGLGTSPDNSPGKITSISDLKSDFISSVSKYGENDQAFTMTLNTNAEASEDC